MQDVAMELLIKALADMKTQEANKQLEEYLVKQLGGQQEKNDVGKPIQQAVKTVHPTLQSSQILLQIDNKSQNDFDTTITNDFDSTLISTINNLQSEMQKQEQQEPQNSTKKNNVLKQQNPPENKGSRKLINFRQKALQQDDITLENVQAIVVPTSNSNKKYSFKQPKQENQEQTNETTQKKYILKNDINQESQENIKQALKEQKTYVIKKSNNRVPTLPKKSKKSDKKPQEQVKNIVQIVHIPQKQTKSMKKQESKQQTKHHKTQAATEAPMVIKEQILKKKTQPQNKKQDKMDLAMDIAALVAAEYEKQIQKFNEEEGNKSVKSQELRDLSALINEPIEQPKPKQSKKAVQQSKPNPIVESMPSCISDGEIWPKYDLISAQKLQEKGRGIGAWDRSITTDWQEPQFDELSEGEIQIYNQLLDSLNNLYG